MEKIRSKDGTLIAYRQSGEGPPLLLVHGTGGTSRRWAPVVPLLERDFAVYAMDRRGRGESDDAAGPYAIEREFEDVAAVVDAAGEPVNLLGHSYGAVCAMEASRLTSAIDKLVLYEPPFPVGNPGPIFGPHVPERLDDLLQRGERDALVEIFLREVVGVSEAELQALRRSATWRVRVQAAHTLPREVRMAESYRFDPARLAKVRTPTLFLLGTESPRFMHDSTMAAHAALQNSRVELLPGQGHAAMTTAPEMFLAKVLAFLEDET